MLHRVSPFLALHCAEACEAALNEIRDVVKTIACHIYRSTRRDELYVYIPRDSAPEAIPEGLRRLTGRLEFVMELDLHEGLKLARSDTEVVMNSLEEQGYYVQMPPTQFQGMSA